MGLFWTGPSLASVRGVTTLSFRVTTLVLCWVGFNAPALAQDCGPNATTCVALDAQEILAHTDQSRPEVNRSAPPAPLEATTSETASHRPENGTMRKVYDNNAARLEEAETRLSGSHKSELEAFLENWEKNHERYEAVAAKVDLPAALIAALHWRESSGNFETYLHQGDPLGVRAVNIPTNIDVFYTWEPAAVDALASKLSMKNKLKLTEDTDDLVALATFAEYYNGLGYHNKGLSSPYVWAGTDQYTRGKYVSDGRYSKWTMDKQIGVVVMIQSIWAQDAPDEP